MGLRTSGGVRFFSQDERLVRVRIAQEGVVEPPEGVFMERRDINIQIAMESSVQSLSTVDKVGPSLLVLC